MSSAHTHVLVSPGMGSVNAAGNPIDNVQPSNYLDFSAYGDEVTWVLRIESVVGAPTAWSLGVRFEYAVEHTGANYGLISPTWVPYSNLDLGADCREGVGWYAGAHPAPADGGFGIVADQTDTLPVTAKRTIKVSTLRHRVSLSPSFTGGTSPGINLDLLAIVRD